MAKMRYDYVGKISNRKDDMRDALTRKACQEDFQKRLATDRGHRLGKIRNYRSKACPKSTREYNCFTHYHTTLDKIFVKQKD